MNELVKELTDQAGRLPDGQKVKVDGWMRVVKIALPLIFTLVLIIPGYTYFVTDQAGQLLFGPGISPDIRFYTLFRLFGLYAFTFVWGQLVVGPFMEPLGKLYGRNWFYFHRAQGLFALLLAIIHPLILYTAYYLQVQRFDPIEAMASYVGPKLLIFPYLGLTAEVLMIVTVSTALLMSRPWLQHKWHYIHFLNYVVFILVFIHSLFLGTEAKVAPMAWLYWLFGATFIASVSYRRIYRLFWSH